MINKIEKLSEQVLDVANSYFELPLGGKKVRCPYFMNLKKQKAGLRVMVGKGTAEEIVHEVRVWAKLKGFDLDKATENEIREFMINLGIGIDCSGYVVYILDALFKQKKNTSLFSFIRYRDNTIYQKFRRKLRPVENIGANLLTSELNCVEIKNLNEIRPGDLIRAKGKQKNAHHVAIISKVFKDKQGNIRKFDYLHSHRLYGKENGVRKGSVVDIDPSKELKDQVWQDDFEGKNYMLQDLLVDYEDNGIRRPRAIA